MVTLQLDPRLLLDPLPDGIEAAPTNPREVVLRLPAGRSLLETLASLGIHMSQPAAAIINGVAADLTQILAPGDQVRLVPQISGGN
jgi:sulfur carrier protein ThiS